VHWTISRLVFLLYFTTALGFSQSEKPVTALDSARYFSKKGKTAYAQGDFQKAVSFFKKSTTIFSQKGSPEEIYTEYNQLGNALSMTGEISEALDSYLLSVTHSEKANDSLNLAKVMKNIGTLYSEQKNFPQAMQYYETALKYAQNLDDKMLKADCLNNIGVVYEQQEQYEKAIAAYSQAEIFYFEEKNESRLGMVYNNLAIVYKYLEKYQESMKYYQKALVFAEKIEDKYIAAVTKNNMGNLYALIGNYQKSLDLCTEALQESKTIDAKELMIETYGGISTAYEKMGNYPQALAYFKLYEQEKHDFINLQRSEQLAEMEVKYEVEKKENHIQLLQQQEEINGLEIAKQNMTSRIKSYVLFGGLLLVVVTAVYVYFLFRKEKKLAEERRILAVKEAEEQERARMARDIHDDLGSGLSKIRFLTDSLENAPAEGKFRSKIEAINHTAYHLVDNMRDLIWTLTPDNNTLENLLIRIREFANDYFNEFSIETDIVIPEDIPQKKIRSEAGRHLFSVVKETMQNVVKHSEATLFQLNVSLSENKLYITMKDNGKGFDTHSVFSGNGLKNMQSRMTTIGGTLNTESHNGVTTALAIDLEQLIQQN